MSQKNKNARQIVEMPENSTQKTSNGCERNECNDTTKNNEIWKLIELFDFEYYISNFGRVKDKNEEFLQLYNKKDGYVVVQLRKDSKYKLLYVHRLVAEYFIRKPKEKEQVNHKNFIRNDNRIENLEWFTPKENVEYSNLNRKGKENPYKDDIECERNRISCNKYYEKNKDKIKQKRMERYWESKSL